MVQSWFDAQTGGTHPVFARDGDSISVLTVNLSGSLEELDTVGKILGEIREALPATNNQPLALFVEGQLTSADGVVTGLWLDFQSRGDPDRQLQHQVVTGLSLASRCDVPTGTRTRALTRRGSRVRPELRL